jgi:hypothetical protein
VLLALSLALVVRAAPTATPADPDLNPKGRAILAYFQQLQASPDLKLVSGQFCGWSGASDIETLAKIERATGKWPAVIGLDYCAWDEGQAVIDVNPPNRLAKLLAPRRSRHLLYAPNPANPGLRRHQRPGRRPAGTAQARRDARPLDEVARRGGRRPRHPAAARHRRDLALL